MKLSKKIISILLSAITLTNVFAGLTPETMVFMGNRAYKRAKDLDVGDHIPIYNIPRHCLERQRKKILEISTRKTKELILIEAEDETLAVGPDQKLYNRRIKKFIPAEEFRIGDKLFSPEKGNLLVTNVSRKRLPDKIKLYDISIENGNIFLILTEEKTHILAHNFAITIPILTWTFGGKLVVIGVKALCVAIGIGVAARHAKKRGIDFPDINVESFPEDGNNASWNEEHFHLRGDEDNSGLDDVLNDAKKEPPTKGKSKIYSKPGGDEQRAKDFDSINFDSVKTYPNGTIVGKLPDGRIVNTRAKSTDKAGRSTIEIHNGKSSIKIRYDN